MERDIRTNTCPHGLWLIIEPGIESVTLPIPSIDNSKIVTMFVAVILVMSARYFLGAREGDLSASSAIVN